MQKQRALEKQKNDLRLKKRDSQLRKKGDKEGI